MRSGTCPCWWCRCAGPLRRPGDLFEPHRLTDPAGCVAGPAAAYLREVAASERAAATQRSYGMDLLRWFRFRFWWAVEVPWDQATRAEARDFLCWIQLADKPSRSHWRYPGGGAPCRGGKRQVPGSPNPVTGKPPRGRGMPRRRWRTARLLPPSQRSPAQATSTSIPLRRQQGGGGLSPHPDTTGASRRTARSDNA
jgi:hypothetical protein